MWGQEGEPLIFALRLFGGPVDARQADDHVFAKAEDGVVGAGVGNRRQPQASPLGELAGDQALYECGFYRDLVGVHSLGSHWGLFADGGLGDALEFLRWWGARRRLRGRALRGPVRRGWG